MGAASEGLKAGKKAGQKAGKKHGQNVDPEENGFKEGAKATVKSGTEGAAKGAAAGAGRGAVTGIKDGASKGAKIGASVPYIGAVLAPIGGVVGGAVGGVGGSLVGGATGAASGMATGASEGAKEATINRKRNSPRKIFGSLLDNIKGAVKGDVKQIFILKAKVTIYVIIAILIFAALIVEGIAEDTAATSRNEVTEYYSGSTSQAGQLYNETGSLALATEEDVQQITNNYLEEIEDSNASYHSALSTVYSGKKSSTVASRVLNITTNYEANETTTVASLTEEEKAEYRKWQQATGAISPADSKTIYEHILNTEKYNFNNIIWRSFEKQSDATRGYRVVQSPIKQFTLDTSSGLVYPSKDLNATNGRELDINFFLTKVRPYLQTWQIPFDLIVGTQDSQTGQNLNTDFAYEIITSAYHEIVVDRYKTENLDRTTNYLVYDQSILTTTTTRTCATYTVESTAERKKGAPCTKDEYNNGLCEDYIMEFQVPCNDTKESCAVDVNGNVLPKTVSCNDSWQRGCSYGVLKEDRTETVYTDKVYCLDTIDYDRNLKTDIRESKSRATDNLTYSWNYVVSSAKMLDKVVSYTYRFSPFYRYPTENYYKFINKVGNYATMSVSDYRESELVKSNAMDFTTDEQEYRYEDTDIDKTNFAWNKSQVVTSIPENATLVAGTTESKIVTKVVETRKMGKEYIDRYSWTDSLSFGGTKSGIYNVDSVKDVTGDDLTTDDYNYYNDLYAGQELNLIDLMNSDNNIYENYVELGDRSTTTTTNIGIRRSALDISYNVLKKELQTLSDTYPITGLMYGSSFGLLQGLNLGSIVASNSINDAIVYTADAHLGYNLDRMMTLETYGTFFRNHWCAMFVSYCLRTVEHQAKISIPIPTFYGCTTFWKKYHNKPGFYDVQEWIMSNPNAALKNTDSTHIASLAAIQPGDIILYCWDATEGRHHTAIVKSVEKDESGNVIAITTIDGNWNGTSYNNSTVQYVKHTIGGSSPYSSLSSVASFISVSTVLAEAENGNIW